ncbi:hypothetical protein Q1695_011856 [Nippostrongylus brasiliensis]|nr:hypothetical protein Q1695_011856 [Nippostrongylus brasiliensis]
MIMCKILLTLAIFTFFDTVAGKLVSVTVLFRHGARAPTDKLLHSNDERLFPNGLGELTALGIDRSFELGTFLRELYVKTGFLRAKLLPSQALSKIGKQFTIVWRSRISYSFLILEVLWVTGFYRHFGTTKHVYFRSKANNRCLMTAALVANGMFDASSANGKVSVPVYSQESNDTLLGGTITCDLERNRMFATCGKYPMLHYDHFTEYEGFVYDCMGLRKKGAIYRDGKSFSYTDTIINMEQNGLRLPSWFAPRRNKIYWSWFQVQNFILGSGQYHDPNVLRLKSGFLLHTILSDLNSNWEMFKANGSLEERKFVAYSTQDWLIHALLNALGVHTGSNVLPTYDNSNVLPSYNSLIMIELHEINGQPFVKLWYRDHVTVQRYDLTRTLRGCESLDMCPLNKMLNCCTQYTTAHPIEECHPNKTS